MSVSTDKCLIFIGNKNIFFWFVQFAQKDSENDDENVLK